jgi:hypothetical protein
MTGITERRSIARLMGTKMTYHDESDCMLSRKLMLVSQPRGFRCATGLDEGRRGHNSCSHVQRRFLGQRISSGRRACIAPAALGD